MVEAKPEIVSPCDHGIKFDARCLDEDWHYLRIRKEYPRGEFTLEKPCPKGCGFVGIYYASFQHFIAGEW